MRLFGNLTGFMFCFVDFMGIYGDFTVISTGILLYVSGVVQTWERERNQKTDIFCGVLNGENYDEPIFNGNYYCFLYIY